MHRRAGRVLRAISVLAALAVIGAGGFLGYRALTGSRAGRCAEIRARAAELLDAGDRDGARILLARLLAEGGANNADRVNLALCQSATGRADEALLLLERLARESPHYAPARSMLAELLYARGRVEAARSHALAALAVMPGDASARLVAGLAAFDLGRTEEARLHLRAVKPGAPGRIEALLAIAALGGADARRALEEAGRRIADRESRSGEDPGVLEQRARWLAVSGRSREALAKALAVLERDPGRVASLDIALSERPERGEKLLAAAEGKVPPDSLAVLRARWLERRGLLPEALAALPPPDRPGIAIRRERARLLARAGRLPEAVTALAACGEDPPRVAAEALVLAIEHAPPSPSRREAAERTLGLLRATREPGLLGLGARLLMLLNREEEANRLLDRPEVAVSRDPAVVKARTLRALRRGEISRLFRQISERADSLDEEGLLDLAGMATRTGRPDKALELLDRIGEGSSTVLAARARALLRLGRESEVVELLAGAAEPELLLLEADALGRAGRLEEAEAAVRKAESCGGVVAGRALRAFWRVLEKDRNGAAAILFDDALEVDVRRRALLALADLLSRRGRPDEERFWLKKGRESLPAHPDLLGRLALAELAEGVKRPETVRLREPVRRMAVRGRDSVPLALAEGFFRLFEGDEASASATANVVLATRPLNPHARRLAAYVAIRRGRTGEARRHLECLLALRPRDRAARGLLRAVEARSGEAALIRPNAPRAMLLAALREGLDEGDLDRARGALTALGLPRDAAFLEHLAGLRESARAGRLEEAEDNARAMVKLRPGSPAAHHELGLALSLGGKREEALGSFRAAARLAPDWPAPAVALVRTLLGSGRREEAAEWLESRLKARPRDALAFALLSEVRAAGGDLSGAVAFARRAEEIGGAPELSRPALVRALLAERGAEEAFEAARGFARGGAEPRDLSLAGQAALAAGRLPEAEAFFLRSPGLVASRTGLAEVLARRGKTEEAVRQAAAAVRLDPGDPAVVYFHAALLEAAGRKKEAEAGYERVLEIDPDHALAALALGDHVLATDLTRALALSETAVRGLAEEPEALSFRARVLDRAGRTEEAAAVRARISGGPSREDD